MFQSKFRAYITALLLSFVIIFHATPAFASVSTHRVGVMRNVAPLSASIIRQAQIIIAHLKFDAIAGTPGTIISEGAVRIDRQGQTNSAFNIQLQINGMRSASTIATALIPREYLEASGATAAEVQRVIRSALVQSLDSLRNGNPGIFSLEGSPSN